MADSDSRTLMLVGAINAFREHGIATTSLTEIVERSGAPRGSVYHYFPEGKGQLAGEAVAYFGRGVSAAISSMIAQSSPPEIIDAVVTIFRNSLVESDFTSSCPVAAAAVEGASTPAALTAAGESFTSWESLLTSFFWQQGQPSETAAQWSTVVIASIEGATLMAKAQHTTAPLDRIGAHLKALVSAPS
ncbi:TetR/AcrR family transcriptional regulator [Rhodococcus erythropolis]|uniref:TetR/AcrR family transcriptional regulator n=1 Tax=Rhodococcus erythropolis TaxID=1833 RepID=UPI002949427A|nr:TetR/AcrR family transcriptional regulator [Rhodococcus erythropolis]MDV6209284.1 TetR/AcrR family transcriptional regulator [Rhodococcus erythropolis]